MKFIYNVSDPRWSNSGYKYLWWIDTCDDYSPIIREFRSIRDGRPKHWVPLPSSTSLLDHEFVLLLISHS